MKDTINKEHTEMKSADMGINNTETMNKKALKVIRHVQEKLTGTNFNAASHCSSYEHKKRRYSVYRLVSVLVKSMVLIYLSV